MNLFESEIKRSVIIKWRSWPLIYKLNVILSAANGFFSLE